MGQTPSGPTDDRSGSQEDLELARKAAAGDEAAREAVSRLVHPLIQKKTNYFCKKHCHDHNRHYRCPLDYKWGLQEKDAPLCDLGNASYLWMLERLTAPEELLKFKGIRGAKLLTYLSKVVDSLPFNEKWKDFRFNRHIDVPAYIQDISPLAGKVYRWLIDRHPLGLIAQMAGAPIEKIEEVFELIVVELTERGKLHLLDNPNPKTIKAISLTGLGQDEEDPESNAVEGEIPDYSWDPAVEEVRRRKDVVWKKLTAVERFVVEKMVMEDHEAMEVLDALMLAEISIKEGVPPEKIDRQQLFHFKRETIKKLRRLLGLHIE